MTRDDDESNACDGGPVSDPDADEDGAPDADDTVREFIATASRVDWNGGIGDAWMTAMAIGFLMRTHSAEATATNQRPDRLDGYGK